MIKKKVIFYHGLFGSPNIDKQNILIDLGYDIVSEKFYYDEIYNKDKGFEFINNQISLLKDVDLIIGNSFGGHIAYNLSLISGIDCIIFNPVLGKNELSFDTFNFGDFIKKKSPKLNIIFGKNDKIISPELTLDFLSKSNIKFNHEFIFDMAHIVSCDNFEKSINKILK